MNRSALTGLLLVTATVAVSACTSILGGFDFTGKGTGGGGGGTGGKGTGGKGTAGTGTAGSATGGTGGGVDAGDAGEGGTCGKTCSGTSDCPLPTTVCIQATCGDSCCGTKNVTGPCSEGSGKVCGALAGPAAGTCIGCNVTADCDSGNVCVTGTCQAPTCSDGVQDGAETDVDCGGATCIGLQKTCGYGQKCGVAADCQGGSCTSGVCDAYTMLTGLVKPAGLASNGNASIFTIDNGQAGGVLWRASAPLATQPATVMAISSDFNVGNGDTSRSIVAKDGWVFWIAYHAAVEDSQVDKVFGGTTTAVTPTVVSPGSMATDQANMLGGMVADTTKLYGAYLDTSADNGISGFGVNATNVQVTDAKLGIIDDVPTYLAANSGSLFWTSGTPAGYVAIAPKSGWSSYAKIASGLATPTAIAVDESFVYWINQGDGTIMQMGTAGGTQTMLATGQTGAGGIAVTSAYVYWTTTVANGAVMRVPIGGGAIATVVPNQASPQDIVVDTAYNYVYWLNTGDGTVRRAPL